MISASFSFLNAQNIEPSGLSDIDQIRKEVHVTPTNKDTYKSRKSAFYRWWRLYWRQGYDLTSLDSISGQLLLRVGPERITAPANCRLLKLQKARDTTLRMSLP